MSTSLTVAAPNWDDPKLLETIKETVCKGATPAQFRMFLEVCRGTGLNPFLKEIYFVPSVGVMAARDGYLRVANQHPQFDGMETRVERDEKNIPIKAVCTVWRKDRGHPVIAEAYYNEYRKAGQVWATYPSAMIAKVAEVLALKRSFAINGVATEEEIGEQEPHGSKEAQADYLAEKGLKPYVADKKLPPASTVKAETVRELADMLDQPPQSSAPTAFVLPGIGSNAGLHPIEMRQAAKVAEADAALKEVKSDKGKGRSGAHGVVPLDKLKNWTKLKDDIRVYTGNDDLYKATLMSKAGCEHSNEIQTKEQASAAWDALQAELKRLGLEANRKRQDDVLRTEMEMAHMMYGPDFIDLIGLYGCEIVDHTLELASEPLEELRKAIKNLGRRDHGA